MFSGLATAVHAFTPQVPSPPAAAPARTVPTSPPRSSSRLQRTEMQWAGIAQLPPAYGVSL